jgi:nucleotide-binding universal stress UspA family protein
MFKRMLVPIDGSHSSATVVPYAAELAKRFECHVHILLVEPVMGAKLPHPDHHRPHRTNGNGQGHGETGALVLGTKTPAHIREANQRYVERHVEEFEAIGVEADGSVVCGDPVEEILAAALHFRSDAIAMTTRKMSNYARETTGSIAEEVLWRSKLPVLIIAHG